MNGIILSGLKYARLTEVCSRSRAYRELNGHGELGVEKPMRCLIWFGMQ